MGKLLVGDTEPRRHGGTEFMNDVPLTMCCSVWYDTHFLS